jgi:hypothetical protein
VQTKGIEVAVAIATSVKHLDIQIDSFGKAIVEASIKVVQDLLPPIAKCADERLQVFERGSFYFSNPSRPYSAAGQDRFSLNNTRKDSLSSYNFSTRAQPPTCEPVSVVVPRSGSRASSPTGGPKKQSLPEFKLYEIKTGQTKERDQAAASYNEVPAENIQGGRNKIGSTGPSPKENIALLH